MKTQLPSGDRGNLALGNLPNADSTCTGDICLATGDRYFSCHASLFPAAHLSDFGVVHFPQQPFCPLSDNVFVWAWALHSMKKVESQKRNSQRLSTSQDHGHGNGRMVCLKRLTDQFRGYTAQCSVSKDDQYEVTGPQDSSDWMGPQEATAPTSCSQQDQL